MVVELFLEMSKKLEKIFVQFFLKITRKKIARKLVKTYEPFVLG
jgi:hypothetical protein